MSEEELRASTEDTDSFAQELRASDEAESLCDSESIGSRDTMSEEDDDEGDYDSFIDEDEDEDDDIPIDPEIVLLPPAPRRKTRLEEVIAKYEGFYKLDDDEVAEP
jgi:hypothetical protein